MSKIADVQLDQVKFQEACMNVAVLTFHQETSRPGLRQQAAHRLLLAYALAYTFSMQGVC